MMECNEIMDLIEEYISGELKPAERNLVEQHLETCSLCKEEYEETRKVIEKIKKFKNSLKLREDLITMSRKDISKAVAYKRKGITNFIPVIAASILCIITVFAGSVLVFPSFAATYASALPVVRELNNIKAENKQVEDELVKLKAENEELKMELVKIQGKDITQVNTSNTVSQEERLAVQQLAVGFVMAQFKGDIELIKSMCTENFKSYVESNKNSILWRKNGEALFTQITNVAKEGDRYFVFVRLNETGSNGEADYQENFEIIKINGEYLVDFMGNDA